MKVQVVAASLLLSLGCVAVSAQAAPDATTAYTFTEVNYPGDTFTQLLGINNSNEIAGYHGSGLDPANPNKGFTLTLPNNFTAQNYPGSVQTQVIGINSSGHTAGFYVDKENNTHGFIQSAGVYVTVTFPGTTFNQLLGKNDLGEQAGYWQDNAGNQHPYVELQSGGIFQSILIPGAVSAQATGVNKTYNAVSGFYVDAANVTHGFLLSEGTFTPLNFPGAMLTMALGVNNSNQVVGSYNDASGNSHGFIWSSATGYLSIDDPNGVGTTVVNGINDAGWLVGFWGNTAAGISHGFVAKP
jgi:hypothetical protein